ncbi:Multimodular transpeptidase-transglycosylase [Minicystis rosea]|nr:Multimodular transpeptidase-transglycosylase [Minicystis rosea]
MRLPSLSSVAAALRPARLLRLAGTIAALVLVSVAGFQLTPPSWWVDPARFARPRDAFEILDRRGRVIRHARVDGVDRRWVALREISPDVIDAFLAVEDARFREHHGVDLRALLRAVVTSVRPWGRRSGGSTITQQLVKRVYGRPLGPLSKVVEIARAAALERIFTKDEILEQYLNRVPFGDRIEGVARASEEYFGRPVGAIGIAEAALLAGIPQAPSATEPRRHLARARMRRDYVLARLAARGRIDEATQRAVAAELPAIRAVPARPDEAPRFADAVLARWKDGRIERRDGAVRTSLDLELQRRTDDVLAAAVARFSSRGVSNGAAVVIANATGEILAYTGAARRGPDVEGGSLDLLTAPRQPGSTLKPFAYAIHFERGGTAATVLDDISLPRLGAHGTWFDARDYDGRERGPVRARVALAGSLNLAALDVAARVGQTALLGRFAAMGLRVPKDADHYGAAAVLGGLDVAPLDLASAYVTLARGGTRIPPSFTTRAPAAGTPVLSPAAAEVTRDILADPQARADAFGADLIDLAGGARFALKTGTSSGWRDAWAAVFTESLTVVVWLGDPAARPLGAVSGFEAAAPAAVRILAAAVERASINGVMPVERDAIRLVPVAVCAATGHRPGPRCRHVVEERFAPQTIPSDVCEAHDEAGDVLLPARYAAWIERVHPPGVARAFLAPASTDEDPVVREPRDGARFLIDSARGVSSIPLRAMLGAQRSPTSPGRSMERPSKALRGRSRPVRTVWLRSGKAGRVGRFKSTSTRRRAVDAPPPQPRNGDDARLETSPHRR